MTRVIASVCVILVAVMLMAHWTINRIYVPVGKNLLLRYKGPLIFGSGEHAKLGHWAAENQVGVLQKLRGPGRHFYCPIWWERQLVDDIIIKPGEVGIVTCKLGDALPNGEFLVDGEIDQSASKLAIHKGVLRKCLGPGRYRINPYGFEVQVIQTQETISGKTKKHSGWVNIPTGSVGVVTNLADNPEYKQTSGIQDKVLPPGLYPINPREQQIDIVAVGYWETSIDIEAGKPFSDLVKTDVDKSIEENIKGGIQFPSSDGFNIIMDFTAIWGLMPDQAPNAIRRFGNVELVESKVVSPQIESICRNNGSEYSATQLLVGSEREVFQNETLDEFKKVLDEKEISLIYGSVRHIYIPLSVRQPIQMAFISDELRLTREQEQMTAREEANFREAEKQVGLESIKVEAETIKLAAEKVAEGQKIVGETAAETRKLAAVVERQTAEFESQAKLMLGQAENDGKRMIEEAKANKFKLAVEAFGTPTAYNNWTFANGLPDDIDLKLFYAGQGTMWTDLKEAVRIIAPTAPIEKSPIENK
jgi:regulator of protease activity HflC (stomatin/prohibitin superfamily)